MTPLGPIEGWSERLRLMVEQVLASPFVASLACGPGRILIYNDAAAGLYGDRHPAALGRPLPATFPEGWATVAASYERAFAGETVTVAGQRLDTRGEGEATDVFDALLTPVRDADGRIFAVHMTGSEVGARLREKAVLEASEAHYRYLFDAIDEGFCTIEVLFDETGHPVDYRFLSANASFAQQTGVEDPVGRTMKELVPDHEARWFETFGRIARTGRPERFEDRAEAMGRWFDVYAFRIGAAAQRQVGVLFKDVLARKRADQRLRESEEHQAFMLKLSDALRPLADPIEIQNVAVRLVQARLKVSRIVFAEFLVDGGQEYIQVERERHAPGVGSVIGRRPVEDYGSDMRDLRAGRIIAVPDTEATDTPEAVKAVWREIGARARLGVPLIKEGRLVAGFGGHHDMPRVWSEADIALVADTAERTWAALERARAEATLRAIEERQRLLVEGMPQLVWRAQAGGAWTWASPQWQVFTGQSLEESIDFGWLDALHPDERDGVRRFWQGADDRGRLELEGRILSAREGRYRWFQTRATAVRDPSGAIVEWLGTSTDVDDMRGMQERQRVLVHELQHRTRNLIAVIDGIARQTLEHTGPSVHFVEQFNNRLVALARVQDLLSRSDERRITIGDIVRQELDALGADLHDERIRVAGPAIGLRSAVVQTIALAMHELATNARKYGALASHRGSLAVTWGVVDRHGRGWLSLDWVEEGLDPNREAESPTTRGGYGRELIEEALPFMLGARTEYRFEGTAVRCGIALPLDQVGKEEGEGQAG